MLAAVLALPANVVPAEILDQQTERRTPHIVLNQETPDEKVTDSDARKGGRLNADRDKTRRSHATNCDRSFIIPAPSMFML